MLNLNKIIAASSKPVRICDGVSIIFSSWFYLMALFNVYVPHL